MTDIIYDIESYPNVFTLTAINAESGKVKTFECSPWRDDYAALKVFLGALKRGGHRMVGFNNLGYDWPVVHQVMISEGLDAAAVAYAKTCDIIDGDHDDRFKHILWKPAIGQVDLFKIHHFDNRARATSLKVVEFNMRSASVQDLPFPPGTVLTEEQTKVLVEYNIHDVNETHKFYDISRDKIAFREELSRKYEQDFINANDTKIGKDYFIMELEKADVKCYRWDDENKRHPIQTERRQIYLEDVIFPFIKFERPEFTAVLDWLKRQTIRETKGVFTRIDPDGLGSLEQYANLKKEVGRIKNLNCIVDGFQFNFGTGGIHGSVDSTIVESGSSNDTEWILDLDVVSYYPSIAISHNLYPAHLGEKFVEIYGRMKDQRVGYRKNTPENAMLKLALNGVYGDSNNPYSPFYDPQYTMSVTINGQLMLCMLAERLMTIDCKMIQINTDGLTVRVPWDTDGWVIERECGEWEEETKLKLEETDYRRMFIRDVNNYIAVTTNGGVKRKGAFEFERGWHQNQSALVIPRAAFGHLVYGYPIDEAIRNHPNMFDFMLRTKVRRNSRLQIEYGPHSVSDLQNVTRYYIGHHGGKLIKIMPPAPGGTEERRIGIDKDWLAVPMNTMSEVRDINYDYYIEEANKLVDPLVHGVTEGLSG